MDGAMNLEVSTKESPGVREATCWESSERNWGDPPRHDRTVVERNPIRRCRNGNLAEGSQRGT